MEKTGDENLVITPLLCIGDKSAWNGTRKELLPFPDERPAYEHALKTIHHAVPSADTIYISIDDESQLGPLKQYLEESKPWPSEPRKAAAQYHHDNPTPPRISYVINSQEHENIGPTASLLAAHTSQPNATWLVVGSDYPLLPSSALLQLILEYEAPVTCFTDSEGSSEPLLAIWSPEALSKLKKNVANGQTGLDAAFKELAGKSVKPLREGWIFRADTPEDWERAMAILRGEQE